MGKDEDSTESSQYRNIVIKHSKELANQKRSKISRQFAEKARKDLDSIDLEDMKGYMRTFLEFEIADDLALKAYDENRNKKIGGSRQENTFEKAAMNTEYEQLREEILRRSAKYRSSNPKQVLEKVNEDDIKNEDVANYLNILVRGAALQEIVSREHKEESYEVDKYVLLGLLKCVNLLGNKDYETALTETKKVLLNNDDFGALRGLERVDGQDENDKRILADLLNVHFDRMCRAIIETSTADDYLNLLVNQTAGISMVTRKLNPSGS